MGYRVVAPLVYLRVPDVAGALVSYAYYAGASVPDGVDEGSLQHHLDSGLVVKEDDPVAEVVAVPAGTPIPGEPPNVPVTESTHAPLSVDERVEQIRKSLVGSDGKPAQSAPKAEWVEYAKSQGVPEDEASGMSKADLIAKF